MFKRACYLVRCGQRPDKPANLLLVPNLEHMKCYFDSLPMAISTRGSLPWAMYHLLLECDRSDRSHLHMSGGRGGEGQALSQLSVNNLDYFMIAMKMFRTLVYS